MNHPLKHYNMPDSEQVQLLKNKYSLSVSPPTAPRATFGQLCCHMLSQNKTALAISRSAQPTSSPLSRLSTERHRSLACWRRGTTRPTPNLQRHPQRSPHPKREREWPVIGTERMPQTKTQDRWEYIAPTTLSLQRTHDQITQFTRPS